MSRPRFNPRNTVRLCLVFGLAATLASLFFLFRPSSIAPTLTLNLIDGRQITLEQYRGRPLIVTFWATTCTVCLAEMPDWEVLYQTHGEHKLGLIAVAMPYDRADWVLGFAKRFNWNFPVALDPMGIATAAFGDVSVTPVTFLISPAGKISQQIVGRVDFAALNKQLEQWL